VKSSKKKQSCLKKKILIISRYIIKEKKDYKWFFLKNCETDFDFIYLSYGQFLSKNNKKLFIKKLVKILNLNQISLFIDLTFLADLNIKNPIYLENIKFFYEIRELIKKFNIKSLRFNYPLLTKWDVFPWIYLSPFKFLYKFCQNFFLQKYYKFPNTDYYCVTGQKGKNEIFKNNIKIHFFPHFDFLINGSNYKKINSKKNFFVYLDQNYQFSHDIKIIDYKYEFSTFEEEINNFFLSLKKKLNIDIVIASHPKRNLRKKSILTKNWKVIKGKTTELVANSTAVIAHNSASINYAVLNKKPLIFLTTNQLENSDMFETINSYSKYFEKKKINVSEINYDNFNFDKSEYLKINKKLYDKYIKNFIALNKNKNFKQILKKII
jgi:hypothetical protein